MTRRFQFSIRWLLAIISILAVSLAAIVQVPHVFVFALALVSVIFVSLTMYRLAHRPWLRLLMFPAFVAAWLVFYVLSLRPFILLSEVERRITGQFHVGRLANAYHPVVVHFNRMHSFRWYISQWIPSDAVGLHALYPTQVASKLVGTWRKESGNLVYLWADGTGLGFSSPDKPIYFEWASTANDFALYQYTSKRSVYAWFGRVLMDRAPTDGFEVIECSATHFKLRDKTGTTYSLTRTQNKELESVP